MLLKDIGCLILLVRIAVTWLEVWIYAAIDL
jgi:hypothetical protein